MIEKLYIHPYSSADASWHNMERKINEIIDAVNAMAQAEDKQGEMTPMDAWHRISTNLKNYYAMRSGPGFKGYTPADLEAEVIAFTALKKMEEENHD